MNSRKFAVKLSVTFSQLLNTQKGRSNSSQTQRVFLCLYIEKTKKWNMQWNGRLSNQTTFISQCVHLSKTLLFPILVNQSSFQKKDTDMFFPTKASNQEKCSCGVAFAGEQNVQRWLRGYILAREEASCSTFCLSACERTQENFEYWSAGSRASCLRC